MTATDRLTKARAQMLMRTPFYGCLALHLAPVETDEVETMATDGSNLHFNPSFIDNLSDAELEGAVAHEVTHLALEHHIRQGARDMPRWNRACDLAINPGLIEAGFTLPDGFLSDAEYDGLCAEEIYTRLQAQEEDDGGDPGQGQQQQSGGAQPSSGQGDPQPSTGTPDPGGCGAVTPAAEPYDKAALESARAEVQARVRQAAMAARRASEGHLPDGVERLIAEITAPRVDWRDVLRQFIDDRNEVDFSWQRPNRRFLSHGLILPGTVADGVSHIVVAVDTSASIDQEALAAFAGEITAAYEDGSVSKVTVIYADTKVHHHDVFSDGDQIRFSAKGRGGTQFSKTFEWIAEHADDAVCVVYFTDLKVTDFGEEPHCPTLWAVYGDPRNFDQLAERAPFGTAIHLSH